MRRLRRNTGGPLSDPVPSVSDPPDRLTVDDVPLVGQVTNTAHHFATHSA
jgi:hypothetical protein